MIMSKFTVLIGTRHYAKNFICIRGTIMGLQIVLESGVLTFSFLQVRELQFKEM